MNSSVVSVDSLAEACAAAPLRIIGQLYDASNVAFFGWAGDIPVIYKPVRGERPLWDFPTGCLAHRERASYLIDAAAGFDVVPPTVLHDGPAGLGSVQVWVTDPDLLTGDGSDDDLDDDAGPDADVDLDDVVDGDEDVDEESDGDVEPDDPSELDPDDPPLFLLVAPDSVAPPWLPVFQGELPDGRPVVLVHADSRGLRSAAVLDAVLNNSDRKGSHVLRGQDGHLWGIDHGVTLHESPKLRTVLWGWAGERIPEADLARLTRLAAALKESPLTDALEELLTVREVEALTSRVSALLEQGRHPLPQPGWPAVPWPPL